MTILVIGGCQVYGYGLTDKESSFLDQFVYQLSEQGYHPEVTSYVFLPLADIRETLTHLDLSQFDLLLIQPAHYYLQHPPTFWKLFKTPPQKVPAHAGAGLRMTDLDALRNLPLLPLERTPASWVKRTKSVLKCLLLTLGNQAGLVKQLLYVQQELTALLKQLQIHRQKVFLLTPTPHRELVSQWLRKQGRSLVIHEGHRWGITVLDTHSIIKPQEEFYISDDPSHLNAIGHELMGRALFACYNAKRNRLSDVEQSVELQPKPAMETA
ncbi:SGNH/GDSL hydrolase family protein [Spirosoma sp. KCTC 42546]|uniref:SGNH/GDSL hydrolase family protein n=1 Tax=Spirosoma sp. KCTC 42546 TaxID=2520506 RepID=UPI0011582CFE|nr:SGNH/GDSL hydrolase family protein [Spirosoma sp. KCTC 42546]QDK78866.1 SGNH/GDSL hydrolase family protein [Spirosoma sp. KCTC 42546]